MTALSKVAETVFGETRLLPVSVAALLGAAASIRALAPELWTDGGGVVLLGGAILILMALTRRPAA